MAVIAALPITAMADYTYSDVNSPTPVANNGTAVVGPSGPYVTVTIQDDDDGHIASTAYVKGAYNDTIAAINRQSRVLSNKQGRFIVDNPEDPDVAQDILTDLDDVLSPNELVTGMAVKNAVNAVDTKIDNKRVEVYTTWEDDSEKTQVAFVNAPAQQNQ